MNKKKKKVLAIASAGGHWIELLRIRPAFSAFHVVFVSTNKGNAHEVQPEHLEYHNMLVTQEFNKTFDEADLIVAHAGMGIVLKSLVANKPIIIMPRKLEMKEHTTDHQMATARALDKMKLVHIAWNNQDLLNILGNLSKIKPKKEISEFASAPLVEVIEKFIVEV
ncbi:hypothetical protein ES705_37676 [subsurface metagenome]